MIHKCKTVIYKVMDSNLSITVCFICLCTKLWVLGHADVFCIFGVWSLANDKDRSWWHNHYTSRELLFGPCPLLHGQWVYFIWDFKFSCALLFISITVHLWILKLLSRNKHNLCPVQFNIPRKKSWTWKGIQFWVLQSSSLVLYH